LRSFRRSRNEGAENYARPGGTGAAAVHNTDTSLSVSSSAGTAIRMRRLYVLYSVEISRHNYTARDMRCIPPRQERSRCCDSFAANDALGVIMTRRGGAVIKIFGHLWGDLGSKAPPALLTKRRVVVAWPLHS